MPIKRASITLVKIFYRIIFNQNNMYTDKYRCFSDWKWEYATLDEICSNIWFDYGTPSNVVAFVDGKYKTKWTWLLDKNWKEIYFWDIISNGNRSYIVWWYERSSCIAYFRDMEELDQQSPSSHPLCKGDMNFFEVIWNIYEHKDLLTK